MPCPMQVTVDYVAMTPKGKVFDSSLEKGRPYDVRIGSGQVGRLLLHNIMHARKTAITAAYSNLCYVHRP